LRLPPEGARSLDDLTDKDNRVTTTFPTSFLWGASTAPHQIEGNNINSDWWAREQVTPGMDLSGDACDSYHRYAEDIALLADAGLTSYRFGIEWSRIEPIEGRFSRAELAHYRRMIEACFERGITPVITLQHFTTPQWFAEAGGWSNPDASSMFQKFVAEACTILDGIEWVATMNEPNMQAAIMTAMKRMQQSTDGKWVSPTVEGTDEEKQRASRNFLAQADPEIGRMFVSIHHAARAIVRERTSAKVGWTIAAGALTAAPGGEEKLAEIRYGKEDVYWEGSRGDDFVGVQAYSSQAVDALGLVPHPVRPDNTLVGTPYRPDSLAMAVRHAWEVTEGVPVLVTENGIATSDDEQRIRYTNEALLGLAGAISDGIDVRGYLHWSLLDNFEWGHWEPTFGLIAVDHETFIRTPKPSLAWLGEVARRNALA
jgi:beta-glucosidase